MLSVVRMVADGVSIAIQHFAYLWEQVLVGGADAVLGQRDG